MPSLTDKNVQDINFAPNDSTKAIASGEYAAWYSTDSGASWLAATFSPALTPVSGQSGRIEIAYARSNPAIVYASIDRNRGELWKSTNGGQLYTKLTIQVFGTDDNSLLRDQGWYDNIVWIDPTNPNIVLVGGVELFRSTNGGGRFDFIGGPAPPLDPCCLHPDEHIIIEHPGFNGSTNKTVFVGNDGGIYKAADVSTVAWNSGWQELNNTLGITQFYGAAGNGAGVIVGGTQDNGSVQYDPQRSNPTESWISTFGGDGGVCAADPTDLNYFYGEYTGLQLYRSTDGGRTAAYIYSGIADAVGNANFIAPFVLDPNTPNTMLAGGKSLWRSTNVKAATPTWTAIKAPSLDKISAIAVAPSDSKIIWVGHNNGAIYKTTNADQATPAWNRFDTGLPATFVTRLTIDPRNPNIVYATHATWDGKTIYRTTNGGTSWSLITGSGTTKLPDLPVYSLSIDPVNAKALYAGTEMGVFASTDGGATWQVSTGGPANVPVEELFWLDRRLVAVTYGRGLFTQYLAPPYRHLLPLIRNDQTTSAASVAYPPPPTPGPYPAP